MDTTRIMDNTSSDSFFARLQANRFAGPSPSYPVLERYVRDLAEVERIQNYLQLQYSALIPPDVLTAWQHDIAQSLVTRPLNTMEDDPSQN